MSDNERDKSSRTRQNLAKAVLTFIAIVLGCLSETGVMDGIKLTCFCLPAGGLVSLATGGSLEFHAGEIVSATSKIRVLLPPGCSGFCFFLILVLAAIWLSEGRNVWLKLCLAYPLSIIVNALRIIVVTRWEYYCEKLFPVPHQCQHLAIGMLIFLVAMMLFSSNIFENKHKVSQAGDGENG